MSRNTPTEFHPPQSNTEYELWIWDKLEIGWFRYYSHAKLKSIEECEAAINEHNTHPLSKDFQIPRDHWKIVRVSKVYEVVEPTIETAQ